MAALKYFQLYTATELSGVPVVAAELIEEAPASGLLLTTVTDMAGFFLVLSLASLFMPQLLA